MRFDGVWLVRSGWTRERGAGRRGWPIAGEEVTRGDSPMLCRTSS